MPAHTVECGLFLTSLVKEQTNVDRAGKAIRRREKERPEPPEFQRFCRQAAFRRPPAKPVEIAFRHSGWMIERTRVMHALHLAHVTPERFDRFTDCGSDCVVEWSPSRQQHRTRANYCGDRFCLPCSRARAQRVRGRVADLLGDQVPLLITLTIRNKPQALTAAIDHLLHSFRRLRQQKFWGEAVKGGCAFIEVKKGARSGEWHPHLHIIAVGRFIPAKELSDGWFKATGDSWRVQIERARTAEGGCSYATKYATKGWTAEIVRDVDALLECVLALRGRRLCLCFGDWHNAELEDDDRGEQDWVGVGSLDFCHREFIRGQPWAIAVMRSLTNGVEEEWLKPPAPE